MEKPINQLKNLLLFIAMMYSIVGLVGGFGYCVYYDETFVGLSVLILGGFAFPTLKQTFRKFFH